MKKKNNKGFSLIELIIAIAILVILTGLLAPQFMRYMEKSREAKDMQTLDTIFGAAQAALAEEKAYKAAKENPDLSTKGVTLETLLKTEGAGDFEKEFQTNVGKLTEAELWSSKAVTDELNKTAPGNVYIMVDADLKVSAWVGAIGATGKPGTAVKTTTGDDFLISK